MARGEGTRSTKTEKGSIAPEAQSLEKEEAPKESAEIKVPEAPKHTRVPDAVQRKLAAKKQKGPQPSRLAQELCTYQAERKRHSMDVYVQITGLDSGKTRGVKALLDSGCSTCCIDTDYARSEKLDIQELPQPIVARNADNTKNISGQITHYVDLRMRIGPHVETCMFLLMCLGKAWIFIGLDWLTEDNPEVDWQEQTMRFSRCPERCHMRGHEEHQAMIDMDAINLDADVSGDAPLLGHVTMHPPPPPPILISIHADIRPLPSSPGHLPRIPASGLAKPDSLHQGVLLPLVPDALALIRTTPLPSWALVLASNVSTGRPGTGLAAGLLQCGLPLLVSQELAITGPSEPLTILSGFVIIYLSSAIVPWQ
ncbi:unnamed protein product [Mycena citricolor]|uniref:Uncharacterized protein n=1 Tax=Mycena citricolor TaxID=2018698 RepID=A0AAD2HW18_9AGAR|nr:unnamed protein product [Mycena citricolor]